MRNLFILALLVACEPSDDPQPVSVVAQPVGADLALEVANPVDFNGRLVGDHGEVRFTTHAEWHSSIKGELVTAGSRIAIAIDFTRGEAGELAFEVTGRLRVEERQALADLAVLMEARYPEDNDAQQPAAGFVRTFAGYFMAWSNGPTENKYIVDIPARPIRDGDSPPDPGTAPPPPPPKQPPGGQPPAPCQVIDNEFVTVMPQCCNAGATASWNHDAFDHCFMTSNNACGVWSATSGDPLATACPGRCGPGCPSGFIRTGSTLYMKDCFDHDLCLVHHSISSLEQSVDPGNMCGDELLEAIDDFGFAYANRLAWTIHTFNGCP